MYYATAVLISMLKAKAQLVCTCTVSLVADTWTSPGVYGKEGGSSNCPHIGLNLQYSQMMDVLPKIEVCVCTYVDVLD